MVNFPFGKADIHTQLAADTTIAITVNNYMTVIDCVTNQSTANKTINLTLGEGVPVGARLYYQVNTAATQTTTFGTGFLCPVLTGVLGKTFSAEFVYNGTNFQPVGAPYQIN